MSGLLSLVLAVLGVVGIHLIGRRIMRWVKSTDRLEDGRRKQVITLVQTARWVLDIGLTIVALMMILSAFGVDIVPMLASVGVAGLAVSLGAQTLIKDVIGGILILVENQYAVGDTVELGIAKGQVEEITLRATQVRGLDGQLYVVPNGEVRIVSNLSRDWSRATVDIGVAYEEDMDRVLAVLKEGVAAFGQDPLYAPDLLDAPQVLGVMSLGDWAATIRILAKTNPEKQWAIGRALRKHILALCEREGIVLPYPRYEVSVSDAASGNVWSDET
jgi:small conductance mechanosensitive channel